MNNDFVNNWLTKFPFKSKQDLYKNFYLKAICNSYNRIDKSPGLENEIRDRFIWDLENENPLLKDYIQNHFLFLDFERQHFVDKTEKRRTDIVFSISGFPRFVLECKLLFQQPSKNKTYIEDGIMRFIELKYSKDNAFAGMIGFVVSGTINTIFNEISESVINFKQPQGSRKKKYSRHPECEYYFVSDHLRINDTEIKLYHLIFNFQ